MPWHTRPIQVLLETWHNEFGRILDEASPQLPSQNFWSLVLTPMKDLMEFRAIHMASTERLKSQNKTQLTNMNQLKTIKKMLEQTTVGASTEKQPYRKGVLDWGIGLPPRMGNNAHVISPRSTELWIRC